MSSRDADDIWSDTAPEYMREGKMYARVTYDNNGEPDRVTVGRDQFNLGSFDVVDGTAVLDESCLRLTLPEPDAETIEYVEQLPFVDEVVDDDE